MKKLLFLLIALLSTAGAWAETYTITYDTSTGTFYRGGSASTDWSSKWVSNEAGKPVVTISTSVNNMNGANGRIAPQTYTITVEDGYIVTGFSMNCPTFGGTITVTPNGESATEVATGEKIVVNSSASSFVFSASAGGARIQAASSDGGSFTITVEDDPNYVDWTPSISNEAFVTVGEKVESISPVTEASDNSKWYILTQIRGGESPMYNVGTGSQLERTATSITPATINGTQATSSLQYLVRFIEVGTGTGLYNMQFANGEFITSSLTTSGSQNAAGTYAFYNSNGGSGSYFGWNLNSNTGSRVDNNGAGYTVAFWGDGTVSGTTNNNVWTVYSTEVAVPSTTYAYQISDESGVVFTSASYSATAGDVISSIPANLQLPYCSYNVTSTTIVNGENVVPVTVSYNLPFTASTDFDNAVWYYATLRGKYLRADDNAKDSSGRYATNSTNEKTDAYKWAFFGNPYTGIYVMNKNQGSSKYLYKETQLVFKSGITPTADNNALFAASPNSNGGFSLRNIGGGAIWYVNDAGNGGNLGFWNSASGANDTGSNWVVTEVPVEIDVTYDLYVGGEKVNTVIDKAAANSDVEIPASLITNYSTLAYNFATEGTIGTENCTIAVTATLKDGIVLPTALSNSKSYTLVSKRGALSTYTNAGTTYLASPVKSALGIEGKEFAIITYEDNNYLYSVSDEKFVTYTSAELAPLAATVTGTSDAISFSQTTSAVYEIRFDNNSSKIINSSASYTYGIVINSWGATSSQWDDGCQYVIYEAEDFDATAALAALEEFFHPAAETQFADAIAALEAINFGTGLNQYSFTGEYAGYTSQAAIIIAGLKDQGYTAENLAAAQTLLANYALNMPGAGFYRIKGNTSGKYLASGLASNSKFAMSDATDATTIFYFDGTKLVNYGSGMSNGMKSDAWAWVTEDGASAVVFQDGLTNGGYGIKSATCNFYDNGDNTNSADRGNNVTIQASTNARYTSWYLEEVTTLPVTISEARYATLYAPVALTIPEGVEAYTGVIIENGKYLQTTKLDGTIPAETAVVLKLEKEADAGTYEFTVTTADPINVANDLKGTIGGIANAAGKYVLAEVDGEAGFYRVNDTNPALAGFKAYLEVENALEVKGFTFKFDDEATAINEELRMKNEESSIYNVAGQRIQKMQNQRSTYVKGINIVNGKKVLR